MSVQPQPAGPSRRRCLTQGVPAHRVITNTEAIAINRAWHKHPGALLQEASTMVPLWCFKPNRTATNSTCSFPVWQTWYKPLSDVSMAVLLVNNGNSTADVSVSGEIFD